MIGLREHQLGNCMQKRGRSGKSLASKSCQGRQLVVIYPLERQLHRSSRICQEELQSDPDEFGLPARGDAPEY